MPVDPEWTHCLRIQEKQTDADWRVAKLGFWGAIAGSAVGTGIIAGVGWLIRKFLERGN